MRTEKFTFTIGVTPGYSHNNENADASFVEMIDAAARIIEEDYGYYISFNIVPTTTLYKEEWGCPAGGEKTYQLSAVRNPIFAPNKNKWQLCCSLVANHLRVVLDQTTVTGEFSEVEMSYFNNDFISEGGSHEKNVDCN